METYKRKPPKKLEHLFKDNQLSTTDSTTIRNGVSKEKKEALLGEDIV